MPKRASIASELYYQDPKAALAWLEKAFGFEVRMVITDNDGNLGHAEMDYGGGYIVIGGEWTGSVKSPKSVAGVNTQTTHVHIDGDVDAHCGRARDAGASILQEPEDQFYGHRVYRAADPEGHVWTFAQTVRQVSRDEAERVSGLKIEGWV